MLSLLPCCMDERFHFNNSYCLSSPSCTTHTSVLFRKEKKMSDSAVKCIESICRIIETKEDEEEEKIELDQRQKKDIATIFELYSLYGRKTSIHKTSLACCLLYTSNAINSCLHYFSK